MRRRPSDASETRACEWKSNLALLRFTNQLRRETSSPSWPSWTHDRLVVRRLSWSARLSTIGDGDGADDDAAHVTAEDGPVLIGKLNRLGHTKLGAARLRVTIACTCANQI